MITRPLDLVSRAPRPARSFDAFYFINAGLLVMFFLLFGSRFVLAPGLGVRLDRGFALPTMAGAKAGAIPTNVVISVPRPGEALVPEGGLITFAKLEEWLAARAREQTSPVLLIRADYQVPMQDIAHIQEMAARAGFVYVQVAFEEAPAQK